MTTRRAMVAGSLLAASAVLAGCVGTGTRDDDLQNQLADLERRHGGRLGVAVLDTATKRLVSRRGNERFALCSTFKMLAVGYVLARVDRGEESLDRRIVYGGDYLVDYSPITEKHVGAGLTVREICEAAVTLSDNSAANLLLDSFGGPSALTAYLSGLGDHVTRLDRRELELNDVKPDDPRDTTSPRAMIGLMQSLLLGPALSPPLRGQLTTWLVESKTGYQRLRAGIPADWRVGDKTGTGPGRETNDVAIIWPRGRSPLLVAAYYAESVGSAAEREMVLADVGRLAVTI